MNVCRVAAAAVLGIVVAGCASGRQSAMPDGLRNPPVALTPVPDIRQTINAGFPNGLAPTAAVTPVEDASLAALPMPTTERPTLAAPPGGGVPAGVMPLSQPVAPTDPGPDLPASEPALVDPGVTQTSAEVLPTQPDNSSDDREKLPGTPAEDLDQAARSAASIFETEIPEGSTLVSFTAAIVNGEQITMHEWQTSVQDWIRENVPSGQRIPREHLHSIFGNVLDHLIDRTLAYQEAKNHLLKSEQQKKAFNAFIDREWANMGLPKYQKAFGAKDADELTEILAGMGRTIDELREIHRQEFIFRESITMHLKDKLQPTMHDMITYYQEHEGRFHHPAKVSWRELVVKIQPAGGRAAARRKAEELLDRLRHGEEFVALARSESDGATADKGGYWQTEPGASAVPAVNLALERLPVGQVSAIIEGPQTYHIVKVEDRSAEGITPFYDPDVQQKITESLKRQSLDRELPAYMEKLRSRAVITILFDGIPGAPPRVEKDARAAGSTMQ